MREGGENFLGESRRADHFFATRPGLSSCNRTIGTKHLTADGGASLARGGGYYITFEWD